MMEKYGGEGVELFIMSEPCVYDAYDNGQV